MRVGANAIKIIQQYINIEKWRLFEHSFISQNSDREEWSAALEQLFGGYIGASTNIENNRATSNRLEGKE